MDTIRFDCAPSTVGDQWTTNIYINGTDLRAIISRIEARQLAAVNLGFINGAYEGVSPFIAFHLYDHFFKETVPEYWYDNDRLTLFDYMFSGVPGDYSLACRIDLGEDRVRWHGFRHFSTIYPRGFNYGDLSFTFDRAAYRAAIDYVKQHQIQEMYV
ncbi:MAG: hypothetical protein AAFW73_21435 [Bacteroidota bacterium]